MIPIPTCCRCRTRKIRCDRKAPKCSACVKAQSPCLIEDKTQRQSYSRQYVQTLINEIQRLETLSVANDGRNGWAGASPIALASTEPAANNDYDANPSTVGQRFVGESSGISFLRYVFESDYWKTAQEDLARFVRQYHAIPCQPTTSHEWPSFEDARILVDSYLNNSHVHHPFLHPDHLLRTLEEAYLYGQHQPSPQNSFLLFMVFAIASVLTFRNGTSISHPYGYFLAAQKYLDQVPVIGSLEAIQNLLLVARFGMYHEINTSLWELSQICMRQCVELGLHRHLVPDEGLEAQQLQRCVFWDSYMNERYSGGTLGRPFAITDEDIETPLPIEASYEVLRGIQPSDPNLDNPENHEFHTPNDRSVFLFAVGLRRIQSANRNVFQQQSDSLQGSTSHGSFSSVPGYVMYKVQKCMRELDQWLSRAPKFPHPRGTYQLHEWYSFLVEKEKLSVIRAGMAELSDSDVKPSRKLLELCSISSIKVIELFSGLFQAQKITWTRNYFQVLFVSGLSLMFCQFVQAKRLDNCEARTQAPASPEPIPRAVAALELCSQVLLQLSKEMPDSRTFYVVFEVLKKRFGPEMINNADSASVVTAMEPIGGRTGPELNLQPLPASTQGDVEICDSSENRSRLDTMQTLGTTVSEATYRTRSTDRILGRPGMATGNSASRSNFPQLDNSKETHGTPEGLIAEDDQDWSISFSEEIIDQMVADMGDYVWNHPAVGSSIWGSFDVPM